MIALKIDKKYFEVNYCLDMKEKIVLNSKKP